ncbi:ABC transporter permease subunit [Paracoccus limosus]|jgi:sulfonate transport system permease protein|uniref:ABC transporter permease subunit n=1 Tax=Paracoccus limosus TaxID=913252 RepID=A0A844H7E7_9RHOB|nr:ABC transporter permease subunit [Paracoccus limosus]MTH35513.1 ABC transporter permease subunit [Paracoccus limosus]
MSLAETLNRARFAGWRPGLPSAQSLLPYAVPAAILLLWELAGATGYLSDTVMPRPSTILATGARMTASGELVNHLGVSAARALAGLVVGGGIGFALGVANGVSRRSELLTDTTLQMVRNIPHLALIPLVILWFGIGEGAKLFLVALGVFFPIYLNTLHGIRNVDPQLIEMGRAYGMNGRTLFRRVVLPGALPSIFVGLRYGLGIMWLTLIVAETLSASSGLGYMAMQAREFMVLDVVVLAILLYAALGKLADTLTRALERRVLKWSPAYANH